MNYRHLFHAGNFADVFKHTALLSLLRALHKKDTPICYLDTHAGSARYDLAAPEAERSPEYRDGIARLWEAPLSGALADYVETVRSFNADGRLRVYPGSPHLARRRLRAQDRMILCEKHPAEYARLRAEFACDAKTAAHERDGFEAMKALLPPKERRGLVLIDPAYERPDEFDRMLTALDAARTRWPTGIYAVWLPIKNRAAATAFYDGARKSEWTKVLAAELLLFPEDTRFRLNGCGMVFFNPPWGFDDALRALLPELLDRLGRADTGHTSVDWLVEE
ncbi:MAG TPA: 23S rRNA (adenine(2030)-N(6))-methyltransferase RlmJ [Burkholderiales bacterium]|nr:23S rRNA (adenine(2030)-N(6))-methyltransferase RlmJ [Burkholderiales bacterium]